jgi:tetratricopeptide (TPR) repeat protein
MKKGFLFIFLLFSMVAISQTDFDAAKKLYQQGNLMQAQKIFEKIIKVAPNNLEANEYLGDIFGQNKSWDSAIFYYKKVKTLNPAEANYWYKYGGALGMKAQESNKFKALGMIDEVEASFKKAIQLDPNHIEARKALVELYLQLPAIIGGSEKKATKYANEIYRISPVEGYIAKGKIAEYFNRYTQAELFFKKAIELVQSRKTAQNLADLYKNKMNLPEKAKTILELYSR